MSSSVRFLGLALFAWAGVRAIGLVMVPTSSPLQGTIPRSLHAASAAAAVPPLPPTQFAPVEQGGLMMAGGYGPSGSLQAAPYPYPPYGYGPPTVAMDPRMMAMAMRPVAYPYPVYVPTWQSLPTYAAPPPRAVPSLDRRQLAEWPELDTPVDRMAMMSGDVPPLRPARQVTPTFADQHPVRGFDRWQLSSWAMLRSRPGPATLATNGMLGGSQAGARLIYRLDPRLGISVRTTSALQSAQRGLEVAAGVRVQPLRSLPVAVTIERRQWIGKDKGRSDFALFAEGGLWGRQLPMNFRLDGYLQGGIVGTRQRDWFVDGSAAATRPLWRNLSAGAGVWGGAQKDLARLDAGPRVTLDMGKGMRVHADYRARLRGNAEPGSGAVVTLAGDF